MISKIHTITSSDIVYYNLSQAIRLYSSANVYPSDYKPNNNSQYLIHNNDKYVEKDWLSAFLFSKKSNAKEVCLDLLTNNHSDTQSDFQGECAIDMKKFFKLECHNCHNSKLT